MTEPAAVSFTVLIPTLDEASTVAGVVAEAFRAGAEHVIVLDSGSTDGTVERALAAGAACHEVADLAPGDAPRGKGDALWRGLTLVTTPYVVFLDGDLFIDGPDFIGHLLRPLLEEGKLFSKAAFTRVRDDPATAEPGRITTLVARPLLRNLFGELAELVEPLSGQIAAPTDLLRRLPFEVDYGLEIAMLIDLYAAFGPEVLAHPDCGNLAHISQDDAALGVMAEQVLRAGLARVGISPADPGARRRPPHSS